jgi:hypothetical protein
LFAGHDGGIYGRTIQLRGVIEGGFLADDDLAGDEILFKCKVMEMFEQVGLPGSEVARNQQAPGLLALLRQFAALPQPLLELLLDVGLGAA